LQGCTDNTLVNRTGDMTFVMAEANWQDCSSRLSGSVLPGVRFAGTRLRVSDESGSVGDLNLNGVNYEVGDAVVLINYLVEGDGTLSTDPAARSLQIAASDVNGDGVVLSVADLRYLIRAVTGDVVPTSAKLVPSAHQVDVSYEVADGRLSVTLHSEVDLGAAWFRIGYAGTGVGSPELSTSLPGLTMSSNANGGEMRVLVSPSVGDLSRIPAGAVEVFTVPVPEGSALSVAEIQVSDADGALLETVARRSAVPSGYALDQNYPNPFNAGTVITFNLARETSWTLKIYNVSGQAVRTFGGSDGQGQVNLSWDGTDQNGRAIPSGVYFYRVVAGEFSAAKKMTLIR